MLIQTKRCTKCGFSKPLSAFHTQKGGRFGLRSACKTCCYAYKKQQPRAPSTEKQRQTARRYYERNSVAIRAKAVARYRDNKELMMNRTREWRRNNPDKSKVISQRALTKRKACMAALRETGLWKQMLGNIDA